MPKELTSLETEIKGVQASRYSQGQQRFWRKAIQRFKSQDELQAGPHEGKNKEIIQVGGALLGSEQKTNLDPAHYPFKGAGS